MQIEFWFEFASTYSYPAAMRAEALAAEAGLTLRWRPFLLGPIFAEQGWTTSPFVLQPVKGTYMWRDMERICARAGVPFRRPSEFPQNGLEAARIAIALPDDGTRARFSRGVYAAQFAEGRPIADRTVLGRVLLDMGLDPRPVMEVADTQDNKDALRAQTAKAKGLGIFGAPTWRTPDGELFWGNDRLEQALEWARNPWQGWV
ncbi:2-hydroxychromene-2-carboxylate isomerase [Chachezhania sediminis]|uniref:2-hydroxychromene-2-carboxylate isomerase n=1 Tax=Chachezhania sediminis TaxID=2599291 RepID=UPI00131AAF37|nr:2-hydroxychromene-2-carboxylate isomerase [Chachezhania sediminis]